MLKFRNIDISPNEPVIRWGVEGILTALEMGDVQDWKRIVDAARSDDRVLENLSQAIDCGKGEGLIDNIAPIVLSLAQNHNV